ncbi:arylformamidase [Phenylobacterium parvum]|uniref:Kynurenine formamidase n=1 Tax=Phenylobacterium parvum TaxID=2201350 RepID=A0A2Z3HUI6_9CAUL|nr:arylformamidase [Phenylobacterium parvum]AWM78515.1 arylformamidase [Phenylobacterium parvum]
MSPETRDEAGRRLYDISQPLRADLPVWPGDTPFGLERTWVLEGDCPVNVSRLTLSTHSGAHADAPLHFDPAGAAIDAVDLVPYLGPAQLLSVTEGPERIAAGEVLPRLEPGTRRVLLRTFDPFPHDAWPTHFRTPAPDLVEALGVAGVRLLGIDGPSLDPQDAKDLVSHQALGRWRMAVLEGLVLDGVPDGRYELIAPPLRLSGADASPVRALLRDL